MDTRVMINQLKNAKDEYKDVRVDTFKTNIPVMIDDVVAKLEELELSSSVGVTTLEELEYRLLRNFISHMPKVYRKRNANWVIVQEFLQQGTSKAGSNSSTEKCELLGIDPWGYTLERKIESEEK